MIPIVFASQVQPSLMHVGCVDLRFCASMTAYRLPTLLPSLSGAWHNLLACNLTTLGRVSACHVGCCDDTGCELPEKMKRGWPFCAVSFMPPPCLLPKLLAAKGRRVQSKQAGALLVMSMATTFRLPACVICCCFVNQIVDGIDGPSCSDTRPSSISVKLLPFEYA